jgi:adenine-specific DNA methylase
MPSYLIYSICSRINISDIYPEFFQSDLTDKDSEAVANPSRFEDIAGRSSSKKELAKGHYKTEMSDIFSEIYRVLKPDGSMTVMFTHKETDAWDTLTMSLIQSGFVITPTHPITSEMPDRMDTQGSGSADSTLPLTGRKPHKERDPENAVPTLWSDIEADT